MVVWLSLLLSCSPKQVANRMYRVSAPTREWKEVKQGGADRAWYNQKIQGILYVDSNCQKKFEDRNLKDSYQSLTKGIAVGKPIRESEMVIDDREAFFVTQNGNLDGIPVRIGVVLVSKNECLYDFIYIAPRPSFVEGVGTLLEVSKSLSTSRFKPLGLEQGSNEKNSPLEIIPQQDFAAPINKEDDSSANKTDGNDGPSEEQTRPLEQSEPQ